MEQNDILVQPAMQIIMSAGDARIHITEAFKDLAAFDYEAADVKLKEATKKIQEAHRVQTDTIQKEASGANYNYSVLFTHAQDTLMTVYSELNVAKRLYAVLSNYEKRIQAIEEKL